MLYNHRILNNKFSGGDGVRVLHPYSYGHIEMVPPFQVLSKRLEKPRINFTTLDYKVSSFTTAAWRLLEFVTV